MASASVRPGNLILCKVKDSEMQSCLPLAPQGLPELGSTPSRTLSTRAAVALAVSFLVFLISYNAFES